MANSVTPVVFDGHNDVILQLLVPERGHGRSFFVQSEHGHLDLPRARTGGFGGGFFAVFVPNDPTGSFNKPEDLTVTSVGYEVKLPAPLDHTYALDFTRRGMAKLRELERLSDGQLEVVRDIERLTSCLQGGVIAAVLHIEGAEAIEPDLSQLEMFYEQGLRSLGIVWSRPNVFGHGVPFKFPATPDTGPGLTPAGKELVAACNRMGIMLDLAHLNERGFWDVARLSRAPLVVTHSAAHALAAKARNLTDEQLRAIGDTGGVVGVTFGIHDLCADGRLQGDAPIAEIVRHVTYIADLIGVEHVALGSDYDGTTIPGEMADVTGLPRLMQQLRRAGIEDADLRRIAHENWLRVLRATWLA